MKRLFIALVTALFFGLIGCTVEQEAPEIKVESVTIDQKDLTLTEGESVTLTAKVLPENAEDKTIKWSSSNDEVVMIASNGKAKTLTVGSAEITATAGEKTDFITITVVAKTIHVTGISLSPTAITMKVGESQTIIPEVTPQDATDKSVTWSSSNPEVASVDNGTVSGLKPGSVTITATTTDGGKTAECAVTVKQYVTSISIPPTINLNEGETRQLTATVHPDNAFDKSVSWTSEEESIATVDENGIVTAVSKGATNVIAKANDGSGTNALCLVVVSSACPDGAIDLGLTIPEGYNLYWATCNLGATKPEDYGDYYAWGETETKSDYSWSTYKFGTSPGPFSKYNTDISNGTADNIIALDTEDDAAHVVLGGNWRMPTDDEWTALRAECTWVWTTENGVEGYKVMGTNGNSIFLPAAGYRFNTNLYHLGSKGYYWSSSLNTYAPIFAWYVYFDSGNYYNNGSDRCGGFPVRPVSE